jgi:chaperonin cofactor prefoldin
MPASNPDSLAVLSIKVDTLVRQTEDTNETLRSLTRAVTQLAVIEERQTADRQAVDRAFSEINLVKNQLGSMDRTLDERIKILERKAPVNDLSNGFIGKAVWIVMAAVIGALMTLLLRSPIPPSFVIQAPSQPKTIQ